MQWLTHTWARVRTFAKKHKVWSTVIVLVTLLIVWWAYSKLTSTAGQTRYVLGTAQVGTIVATVSESGQVAANDTLSITPQVSAQVVAVYVKPGQYVHRGQAIAALDSTDARNTVTTAKQNLQSAQLALAKLQEPATQLTLTQQQNALSQAQAALVALYQSSFSDITSTFVDLPTIISSLQDIDLGDEAAGSTQWNIDFYEAQTAKYSDSAKTYRDAAYNSYEAARASYDQTFDDFKSVSSTPDQATIERLLGETYKTTGLMADAVKSANDLIQFYSDQLTQNGATPKSVAATQIASLNTYLSKAQTHLSSLLSDTTNLQNDKDSIAEKQQTLAQTQGGPDTIDVEQDQLAVDKAQAALDQANQTLAKYYIVAPFDGTIASVPVSTYDQAGSGTVLATLITTQQYADLSLNEVDAAKLQLGNKTTLTFDAVPDLTLTGAVVEISPLGAVSQGVVTYDVKVAFDTQDPRIKSGMTANADIQTAVHQNVVEVPSSAVKTQNGQSYVLAFDPPVASSTLDAAGAQGVLSATPPQPIPVTVGISDDTNTEIVSGLSDGQQVVVRTITGTASAANTTTRTATGGAGGARGGIRIGG